MFLIWFILFLAWEGYIVVSNFLEIFKQNSKLFDSYLLWTR